MVFLFLGIIFILSTLLINYYMNNIFYYQKYLNNNQNKDAVITCIYNNYINNYDKIHKINLENYHTNYRLENLYFKIKPGNSVLYNEIFNNGLKLKDLPDNEEELKTFLTKIENCTNKTEYIVYFKDLTYYNNGIVDLPKLNIFLYPKVIAKTYEDIKSYINNNNIPIIDKIDISNELNKRFNILKDTMNEIITSITQYAFANNLDKDKNPFSVKNGLINNNNKVLFDTDYSLIDIIYPKYIQLNGGQTQFIQSNGVIYIDSYINYCFNTENKDYDEFKCEGTADNPVSTLFNTDPASINNFCSTINKNLYDTNIYRSNVINTDGLVDKDVFKDNIGINHIFNVCASYNSKDYSYVNNYLLNLFDDNFDNNLLKKAFYKMYYINDNEQYDINNWTDIDENKTFSLKKGENGWIIYLSNNEDFFKNKFNVEFDNYVNPFFPDKKFDIFINNSGYDIIKKVLKDDEREDTQILKSGSYIEFALPVVPDIATANEYKEYPFGNHIYSKLIEGMIIY